MSSFIAILKTLLLSDLVDSTRLVEQLGDQHAVRLFARHDRLARDLLARYQGQEIDKTDGFLLLFERPWPAVRYALAYHQALVDLEKETGSALRARVGIHLGEVFVRENTPQDVARGAKPVEVEGLAKPTAARLMGLAGPRQTLLTRGAFDLARRAAVDFEESIEWLRHGPYLFQGVEEAFEICEVGQPGLAPLAPPEDSAKAQRVLLEEDLLGPLQGQRLAGRYEVMADIGQGGMGVVYRAEDPVLGREVAIKAIPPSHLGSHAVERFRREARTLAQLDHPSILPIHDFGEHHGTLFLVTPLVEGTTLRPWIEGRRLLLGETLRIAIQIAEALDYSHRKEVVHRDIKPENVMITRERRELRARLMDFGIARETTTPRLTRTGNILGTLAYMSPEQVADKAVDGRSDLYSLGIVLYECLAGEPPFSGAPEALVYRIAHEHPQPLRRRGVDISEDLDALVLSLLAKDPRERPANGELVAITLRRLAGRLADTDRERSVILPPSATQRLGPARAPLVGRKQELIELQARLNSALDGECQLVLVAGEAGSGKSRLLEELDRLAVARGLRVLHGRCADRQSAMPYQGFCELIQDYFRDREGTASSAPELSDLAPDLLALFPVFSELEALRGDTTASAERPQSLEQAEATYVFELFARTLIRLAAGAPLVVLLDNLHAGEVSLEALEYVVRRLGPTPTLFVGTYRPQEVGKGHTLLRLLEGFEGDSRFVRLRLAPLDHGELQQLVALELGSEDIGHGVVERLHRATEGNPFFTRELVRSLLESDDLRRDDSGVWRLRQKPGVTRDALPDTVQKTVKQRLRRLDPARRQALAVASVLGRDFDFKDLEALWEQDEDLDDLVDALVEEGLLEEDRRSRGDHLRFASAVVAEVLHRDLPRRRRRRLHHRLAKHLETRYAGRLERVLGRLVHHFAEADRGAKTVHYGLQLTRLSLAASSAEDALLPARTALEFLDDEDLEKPATRRGELRLLIARAERLAGRPEEALYEAEQAVLALDDAGDATLASEAALFLAETAWQNRHGDLAWRWVERGLTLARRGPSEPLRALLELGATLVSLRGDPLRARAFREEAEALAGPPQDARPLPMGGTLVTVLPSPVLRLDPARARSDEEAEVASILYETLLTTDQGGALRSQLATAWRGSPDGLTFELALREGIAFSDGSPLRAAEVKRSMERAVREASAPPAALAALEGAADWVAEECEDLVGISIPEESRIVFRLSEPLPIFPTLLTDPKTGIAKVVPSEDDSPTLLGTGPFRVAERTRARLVLEKNPHWREAPPRLDRIDFRTDLDASGIAAGLRNGTIDLGRDLLPSDLEQIPRDPRLRRGLVEATKKSIYFVLFNKSSPRLSTFEVRRALAGVVRTQNLVWRSLGRFAQPAVSFLPPGILGHDPGRRITPMSWQEARGLLRGATDGGPLKLKAAILPLMQDRYGSLTRALLEEWASLGVEVTNVSPTTESYYAQRESAEVDLVISRWIADYDDPDNFFFTLFNRRTGLYRFHYSSSHADDLMEKARREVRPGARQVLYQQLEDLFARESVLIPLFHDLNYRIKSPSVEGLKLKSTLPYVNYAEVGKAPPEDEESPSSTFELTTRSRREIHVAIPDCVETLDPTVGLFSDYAEVLGNVFECLTEESNAHIVPRLAEVFETRRGGLEYYVRLRRGVHFHDGRRLTARDVRYSFERLLRHSREPSHFPVLPIRGAQAYREGEAEEISGLRIVSGTELTIGLEEPLPFFPAMLTDPVASIVPEGSQRFADNWRTGCVGTGPFRVAVFAPGDRIELEKNPEYWRPELPKSDRLVFHLSVPPEAVARDFLDGRLTLASHLLAEDFARLSRRPDLLAGYREVPRLATYFLGLNVHGGPFADLETRRRFVRALDLDAAVRETTDRLVRRAHALIPPGLLGHEVSPPQETKHLSDADALDGLVIRVAALPAYHAQYARLWRRLCALCESLGVRLEPVETNTVAEANRCIDAGEVDLAGLRWIANYPDADGVAGRILQSDGGYFYPFCGSPEIDHLVRDGRRETDPLVRHGIYRKLEETIAAQALVVPLFYEQSYRFCQPGVEGLELTLGAPEVRYEELLVRG